MKKAVEDLNIKQITPLVTPQVLKKALPVTNQIMETICDSRQVIKNILDRKDRRLLVVVGPCSIHDINAAKEYGQRLAMLSEEVKETLYLVMRVYFEKPRTTVGWKGLINDPDLNDSFKIEEGLYIARQLLLDLSTMGLPLSTEALDPISPQYLQDLVSWSAIGARTTESQTHREMASGLSSAIGFKNGTDGNLDVAINALKSAASKHRFLGIDHEGKVAIIETEGNRYGHVVLRGGNGKPNYDSVHIALCESSLKEAGLSTNLMVDCSHENSNKKPELQSLVMENVVQQIVQGNQSIIGLMIESNLEFGRQEITGDIAKLRYGQSITDGCISWDQTEEAIKKMHQQLSKVDCKRFSL